MEKHKVHKKSHHQDFRILIEKYYNLRDVIVRKIEWSKVSQAALHHQDLRLTGVSADHQGFVSSYQDQSTIQKLAINIKKDSADRKTSDYFKRRLDTLNQYWSDYQYNHDRLLSEESRTHPYFIGRTYEKAKELYISTKALINQQHQGLLMKIKEAQQEGSTQEEQEVMSRQSPPVEGMLQRALQRTVAGINLDIMSEKWELKDALRILQARWSIIDSLHWELDSELEGTNQEYEVSYTKQETIYNELKNAINKKLGSVVHKENWTPKIDIPFFNGNYQNWVSFKDLFIEAIHSNVSLSNAHKMQFLKSKVRGEAERLIQHLQISSDNYNVCWEILNNRYNNKWLIFTSHLDLVLNLPVMQQANVLQIKKIHDTTLECLNSIRNLGVNIDSWDPFIVRILLLKLDADTHDHYLESLKKPRELPNLNEFLSFLESRFTALESSRKKNENSKPSTSKQNKSSSSYFKNKYSASKTSVNNFEVTCPLCKESHGIYYCNRFLNMTPSSKRQAITRLNLCKNCLYSHGDKECMSEKRCRECNGKHNTLLHQAFNNKSSCNTITENQAPAVLATQNQESQENHVSQQGNNVIETLLATAMIKVQASDGSYHKMRALIDQGSQASLITARATQQLALSRKYCKAVICGIGEKESNSKGVTNITCCSHFNDFTFKTDVVIMDTLIILNQVDELQRFWENEDISESSNLSAEDLQCIEFYKNTTTRHENGMYESYDPDHETEQAVFTTDEEARINKKNLFNHISQQESDNILGEILVKYSSLSKLTRVLAWILRFIKQARNKKSRVQTYLTLHELKNAKHKIILYIKHMNLPSMGSTGDVSIYSQELLDHRRFSSLVMLLLSFMSILTTAYGSYNVTQLKDNQGFYLDKIANMQLIRDDWKIVTYYDMKPFWQGTEACSKYLSYLEQLCNKFKETSHCDVIQVQLKQEFSELEYYNHLLLKYNILKRNGQAINKQHKMLNTLSIKLDKIENVLLNESERNRIMNDFSTGAIATSNVLRQLKTIQTSLLDTVTDVYHGRLNIHLLSPEQLKDTLNTISSHLSKDLTLPINNLQINFKNIYHLLTVKARMTEEFLIFELKLPLVSRDTFSIMKIIPIPQPVGNSSMVTLTPIAEHVAINLKKDSYLPMSLNDVQTCLRDDVDNYLCHIEKPIYHLKNNEKLCKVEPDSSKCKISITTCSNQWTALSKINNYAFFCCNQCEIRVLCDDNVSPGQLIKAGILGVEHDCLIKTESFTVYSRNEGFSTLDIKPSLKLPEIEPINQIINAGISTPLIENNTLLSSNEELDEIKKQLRILKASEKLPNQISYHDIHHYTAFYVMIGVVMVIGAGFMIRRLHHRRSSSLEVARVAMASLQATQHVTSARAEAGASPSSSTVEYSIVHLKRFQYVNNKWIKSQKVVNFPFQDFDPTAYLASVPQETILRHTEILNSKRRSSVFVDDTISESDSENEESNVQQKVQRPKVERKRRSSVETKGRERLESTSLVTTPVTDDNLIDYHGHHLVAEQDPFELKYRLYAVVSHSGQMSGGHYVAYARNPSGAWLCYNDSSCRELPPAPAPPIDPASAYLLFYERQGLDYDRYLPDITGKEPVVRDAEVLDPDENDLKKMCSIM
ncbi:hypothetical protein HW555_010305 [Spodoptera exigua]|uniref:USP domain-containing protein n=1 Tax=Spodoptera exigua TaxID=7107 RepID=A0A835G7D1_SPOEX|nr:hypothetical protein HW555_010305 [Spodoptera exigua]